MGYSMRSCREIEKCGSISGLFSGGVKRRLLERVRLLKFWLLRRRTREGKDCFSSSLLRGILSGALTRDGAVSCSPRHLVEEETFRYGYYGFPVYFHSSYLSCLILCDFYSAC